MNQADVTTLPVRPAATGDRSPVRGDLWPDVLSPHLLYRNSHLCAGSRYVAHNARVFVTAVLADWRLLPLLDDVVLCASELVTNAALHADRPVTGSADARWVSVGVRCWSHSALFLEVGDMDSRMPSADPPDGAAVSGRGLLIVRGLADGVWWRPAAHGGKVVYARFGLPGRGLGAGSLAG